MKKILILSAMAVVAIAGCKKKESNLSSLHNYSVPTLLLPNGVYFSTPVGGALPGVGATAYDSFYNEDCNVVYDQTKMDNTVPGVYEVKVTAKNHLGMAASKTIFVAVTDIPAIPSLAGTYWHEANDDTVLVWQLANGFYMTNDVAANGAGDTTHVIPAFFVQTSDVELVMPKQASKFGTLYGEGGTVTISPTDTTIEYVIRNNAFAPTIRVFKKL